ncbi:MAG: hypothetical protein VZR73_16265 [Acutalibacteraceae bacterium]|nr:hypothetical protein [Acutalibacteraceae bacterium]
MSKKWLRRFMGVSMAMAMSLTACSGSGGTNTAPAATADVATSAAVQDAYVSYEPDYDPMYDSVI